MNFLLIRNFQLRFIFKRIFIPSLNDLRFQSSKDLIWDLIPIYLFQFIKEFSNCKIIYVPRYLNWEDFLKSKLGDINYFWLTNNSQLPLIENNNLTVVWTYGLLLKIFSMSHICLMGNTFFSKKGGHNLVEPAVNANAIILGPDYITCKDLADSLNVTYCSNYLDLIIKTKNLMKNNEYVSQGIANKNITFNKQKLIKQKLNNIIYLFV